MENVKNKKKLIVTVNNKRFVQETKLTSASLTPINAEISLPRITERYGQFSGSFTGSFEGDGSRLTKLDWHALPGKIPGSKVNRGGGAVSIDHVRFADSASFAETASFALNVSTASAAVESFLTFFDSQPAIGIIRNQPAGLIECEPESRKQLDLTNYTQIRISTQVVRTGASSSAVGFQYSTDGGGTWTFMDGSSGPTASLAFTGSATSSWLNLAPSAKSDVLIRWILQGGDGAANPAIGTIVLGLK